MPADTPPAIVMPAPAIPASFRLEQLDLETPSVSISTAPRNCPSTEDSTIIVCGKRVRPEGYRIGPPLPPAPAVMDEINQALTWKVGNMEIGLGHIRVAF